MKAAWTVLVGVVASTAVLAANGIVVMRGSDSTVYGNCVPSLVVENRSGETIDYLQVDMVLSLRDGRQRTVELKSAYREGVPAPIAPGGRAALLQHLDTSRALGVPCGEVSERRVLRTICETERGIMCASSVVVQP